MWESQTCLGTAAATRSIASGRVRGDGTPRLPVRILLIKPDAFIALCSGSPAFRGTYLSGSAHGPSPVRAAGLPGASPPAPAQRLGERPQIAVADAREERGEPLPEVTLEAGRRQRDATGDPAGPRGARPRPAAARAPQKRGMNPAYIQLLVSCAGPPRTGGDGPNMQALACWGSRFPARARMDPPTAQHKTSLGAFPISRSRAHTHRRHGHPLQTVPSAGLIERPQEKNRVDALR